MILLLLVAIIFTKHIVYTTRCACTDTTCKLDVDNMDCTGEYCWAYRLLPTTAVTSKGCFTTRQSISSDFVCEQDRRGGLFCICNDEFCNSEAMVTSPVTQLPVIMCNKNVYLRHPAEGYTCRGHICSTIVHLSINQYGDIIQGTVEKDCEPTTGYVTSLRVFYSNLVDTDDSICIAETSFAESSIECYCRSNYCNNEPIPNITIGSVRCYAWSDSFKGYCKGQYCYQTLHSVSSSLSASVVMGCISVYSPSGLVMQEDSFSSVNGIKQYVCTEDLCNGFPLKSSNYKFLHPMLFVLLLSHL